MNCKKICFRWERKLRKEKEIVLLFNLSTKMIKKIYRLREREVKKVLQKWKPFFSYNIVLNSLPNKKSYHRFAIVIWWKSVRTNVERNFFRRVFYDMISEYCKDDENNSDFVFVVKKKTKLDKTDESSIKTFEKDIRFLIQKIHL